MPPDLRLTKEGVTETRSTVCFIWCSTNPRKGHILGSRSEVDMQFLPAFCPDSKGLTMEVVEYEPDDSYEIRRTHCGCCRLGKISPEIILITKRAIDSPR